MRVALTKGTLRIPPTYFAVEHARAMPEIDWTLLCLAAEVGVPLPFPVLEAVPGPLPFRVKESLKWWALRRMERLLVGAGPELIHQQQATWSLPAHRAAERLGVPMLTTLHGADAYASALLPGPSGLKERAGRAWTAMNHEAARASDRLLAVSRHLADVALESGFPPERLHVHYQGVDTDWWTPEGEAPTPGVEAAPASPAPEGRTGAQPPGSASSTPTASDAEDRGVPEILFVGALSELKGVPDLLRAHARVSSAHRLVLVGDGPLRADLRRAASLDPSIVLLGPLDREGVRERMRRAAALVLPTRTTRGRAEAAGLVALEAQACAVPVVVNETGGAPEMVSPACSDLMTREYDADRLASSIRRILAMSGSEWASRGCEARAWVAAERSLHRASRELRGHYAELLG